MKVKHRSRANGLILHIYCLISREKHFIFVNPPYHSPRGRLSLAPVTFFACELTPIIISIVAAAEDEDEDDDDEQLIDLCHWVRSSFTELNMLFQMKFIFCFWDPS